MDPLSYRTHQRVHSAAQGETSLLYLLSSCARFPRHETTMCMQQKSFRRSLQSYSLHLRRSMTLHPVVQCFLPAPPTTRSCVSVHIMKGYMTVARPFEHEIQRIKRFQMRGGSASLVTLEVLAPSAPPTLETSVRYIDK